MPSTVADKKILMLIFVVALLIRSVALFSFAEEKSLIYASDSLTYLQVAKNILEHKIYSMEISSTPHADNFRTPLYPLFLLPFVWLKTSLYAPAITQNILAAVGICVFFLVSRKIFGAKIALGASLLFALEPFTALISSQIMTEAIFTPLFVLSLMLFAYYIQTRKLSALATASVLLGLAALARPIAFYFFLAIPLAVLLAKEKRLVVKSVIGLGLFFLMVSPWLLFNAIRLHTAAFSSVTDMQFYAYHAKYLDEWREKRGAPANDRLPMLDLRSINDTFDARALPLLKSTGLQYIKSHWIEYLAYHFFSMPALYTDSGYANILNGLSTRNIDFGSTKWGILQQIGLSSVRQLLTKIKNQPIFLIRVFADLLFIIVALLAFFNPLFQYKQKRYVPNEIWWLLMVLVGYTFISSPIGNARFRIPINPILFLLALQSLQLIFQPLKLKPSAMKDENTLDDQPMLLEHRKIINKKVFLRKLYNDFYQDIKAVDIPAGKVVELGSGAGFMKKFWPTVITSDIIAGEEIDRVFSAEQIPYADDGVAAFIMFDVFHHLKNAERALREMERCLRQGGKIVMIEPYNSWWGRFIYKNFHNENFDPEANWQIKGTGRLSDANGALPWIVFVRDQKTFEKKFPNLKIVHVTPHTPLRYLISGGLSMPQLLPTIFYTLVKLLERLLRPLNRRLAMFVTIELEKIN